MAIAIATAATPITKPTVPIVTTACHIAPRKMCIGECPPSLEYTNSGKAVSPIAADGILSGLAG